MNLPVSLFIAARYSRASQGGRFIGFISLFSMAGIALGVMALIVAISVMDGFEALTSLQQSLRQFLDVGHGGSTKLFYCDTLLRLQTSFGVRMPYVSIFPHQQTPK